jgi:hypothetical protein
VNGVLIIFVQEQKNHLLSCLLAFIGMSMNACDLRPFLQTITMVLRKCKRLGISTKLFVFFLGWWELRKRWSKTISLEQCCKRQDYKLATWLQAKMLFCSLGNNGWIIVFVEGFSVWRLLILGWMPEIGVDIIFCLQDVCCVGVRK